MLTVRTGSQVPRPKAWKWERTVIVRRIHRSSDVCVRSWAITFTPW